MLPLLLIMYLAVARRSVTAWTTLSTRRGATWAPASITRCLLSTSSDDQDDRPKRPRSKKKFKVVDEITAEHMDKLAAAFDDLARKDGFTADSALFADDATFEDDDFDDDDDELFDAESFELDDFVDDDEEEDDDDDIRFDNDGDDMEARIAAARRDVDVGRVSVPKELDELTEDIDLGRLGFRPEVNPFGNDETPRKQQFRLIENAMVCGACGADFQCKDEARPGYLPPEKYEIQVKLNELESAQGLVEKVEGDEWSPEDEVEWLLQTAGQDAAEGVTETIDLDAKAEEMGLELLELSKKKVICKRCHGLQNFGKVDDALRPGWTKEPLLSQEKFRELLRPIRDKKAVIIALVDLFDFSGSVLPELDAIAGDNPVILAANKADLLPSSMGQVRIENWVRRELEYSGIKSLANIGGAVRLVSCKTGMGVGAMMAKARSLADELDCDIYVVGAANAGKSTLMNHILRPPSDADDRVPRKKRAGNQNARKGVVTTSPLPGTTLKFIKADLGDGLSLYDTPGLLVPGTLTQLLTSEELKIVVPKKRVEPVTFRVASGKCVLVGGLAKVEVVGDSKPFLLTFFVANEIKLHPTDAAKAEDYVKKHIGGVLTPPLPPGEERLEQIGQFEDHVVDIEGLGWKEAAADISLTGLGWIAVTGAGSAKIKVSVPEGIGVSVRPPLMPFDVWESTAKYTGSKAVRKSTKSASGKRRKGVGRR